MRSVSTSGVVAMPIIADSIRCARKPCSAWCSDIVRPESSCTSSARLTRSDVVRMKPRRRRRVDARELLVERATSALLDDRAMPRADRLVGGGRRREADHERADPEVRAAAEHRHLASRADVLDGALGEAGERHRVRRLERIEHVDEVMGRSRALLGRRLSGADVEAAVDLHAVGGDDLAADALARRDRELRLAGRGRARRRRAGARASLRTSATARATRRSCSGSAPNFALQLAEGHPHDQRAPVGAVPREVDLVERTQQRRDLVRPRWRRPRAPSRGTPSWRARDRPRRGRAGPRRARPRRRDRARGAPAPRARASPARRARRPRSHRPRVPRRRAARPPRRSPRASRPRRA